MGKKMNGVDLTWNLQLLAAVAYAKTFWEEPTVREEVIKMCNVKDCLYNDILRDKEFKDILTNLVEKVKKENLPQSVKAYVAHIVISMGTEIFNWDVFVQHKLHLKIDADGIQWTSIGTIDQVIVFQKWFENQEMFNRCSDGMIEMIYQCAQVEYIMDCDEVKNHLDSKCCSNYELKQTYLHVKKLRSSENQIDLDSENQFKPAEFCRSAITHGYDLAAKFYWRKMTKEEKEENILSYADLCVKDGFDASEDFQKRFFFQVKIIEIVDGFLLEKILEILLFLISEMTESQFKKFLSNQAFKFVSLILTHWPGQELFMFYFEKVKIWLSISELEIILIKISECRGKYEHFGINFHPSFYYQIFEFVWFSVQDIFKGEFKFEPLPDDIFECTRTCSDTEGHSICKIVGNLFKRLDIKLLKLILNDELWKDERDHLIYLGRFKFKYLACYGNFNALDLFVQEILNLDEVKSFKRTFNFYDDLIHRKEFDIAEKLFYWQLNSGDDRFELINSQINFQETCRNLVSCEEYDGVEKLLDLAFVSEKEKEKFRDIFLTDEFIKEQVYTLWIKNYMCPYKQQNTECFKFLEWAFKSEPKILNFRKNKLVASANCVVKFCTKLPDRSHLFRNNALEELLRFCQVSEEVVVEFKKEILGNVVDLIISKDELYYFRTIHFLITWCANNEEENKEVVKRIMNSIDIIHLWDNLKFESNEDHVDFYDHWLLDFPEHHARLKTEIFSRYKNIKYYQLINISEHDERDDNSYCYDSD